MPESVLHSSVQALVNSLKKGQPHDEGVLLVLQNYVDNRDYFIISDETAKLIRETLKNY